MHEHQMVAFIIKKGAGRFIKDYAFNRF